MMILVIIISSSCVNHDKDVKDYFTNKVNIAAKSYNELGALLSNPTYGESVSKNLLPLEVEKKDNSDMDLLFGHTEKYKYMRVHNYTEIAKSLEALNKCKKTHINFYGSEIVRRNLTIAEKYINKALIFSDKELDEGDNLLLIHTYIIKYANGTIETFHFIFPKENRVDCVEHIFQEEHGMILQYYNNAKDYYERLDNYQIDY